MTIMAEMYFKSAKSLIWLGDDLGFVLHAMKILLTVLQEALQPAGVAQILWPRKASRTWAFHPARYASY